MPDGRDAAAEEDITGLLDRWRLGDPQAANQLMDSVYADLHRIAAREMRREHAGQTLQTTAVLHEAYLRIFGGEPVAWKDRAHFYASAATQMRRVLIDHARRAHSDKRGGHAIRLSLGEFDVGDPGQDTRLLALNEALANLEALDPRAAKVAEMRFFGGLNETDAAEVLGISVSTLKRDWDFAKTWLAAQLA